MGASRPHRPADALRQHPVHHGDRRLLLVHLLGATPLLAANHPPTPPTPASSHPHICEQAWGLPALLASRTGAIAALTAFGTLPLSLLPSLSALSFTSALGVAGLLYTAAFMVLRMSSYGPGSALHAAVPPPLRPRFEGALAFSPKAAVLPGPPACTATT